MLHPHVRRLPRLYRRPLTDGQATLLLFVGFVWLSCLALCVAALTAAP